jgi:hypothetical protein
MNESEERMNRAVDNFLKGEEVEEEFKAHFESLEGLKGLERVPGRDPERANVARQAYLDQVAVWSPTVSPERQSRLNRWMSIFRKERSPMLKLARIITISAILLGGTAGTAFAAQESLPDQALYPVKTLIEDVRLGLTADPQAEFDLLMAYVQERFEEIEALVEAGKPVTEDVQVRLQNQLQSAFQNAAELDDNALIKAMEQVRTQSQMHVQLLSQLNKKAPEGTKGNLETAEQAVIRSQIQAEGAMDDPNTLRTRYGAERNEEAPDQPEVVPPGEKQGGTPEGAGTGEGLGPSGSGNSDYGTPGPRRNGQSQ